jgi:hypothetical protein
MKLESIYNKYIATLILLILLNKGTIAQSFLDISSFNTGILSMGLNNNNYFYLSAKPAEKLNIIFNNSIFIEKIYYQHFSLRGFYKLFNTNSYNGYVSIGDNNDYRNSDNQFYFTLDNEVIFLSTLKIAALLNIVYDKRIEFYSRLGAFDDLNRTFGIFAEYGSPFYGFKTRNVLNAGCIIKETRVGIKTFVQIPDNFKIKYIRLLIGFNYIFIEKKNTRNFEK